MQLRMARLCLDCEEIHDRQECPACGSESFGYISKWIPAPERRSHPRPSPEDANQQADIYRQLIDGTPPPRRSNRGRWLTGGALGVAAISAAGWLWRRRS